MDCKCLIKYKPHVDGVPRPSEAFIEFCDIHTPVDGELFAEMKAVVLTAPVTPDSDVTAWLTRRMALVALLQENGTNP